MTVKYLSTVWAESPIIIIIIIIISPNKPHYYSIGVLTIRARKYSVSKCPLELIPNAQDGYMNEWLRWKAKEW